MSELLNNGWTLKTFLKKCHKNNAISNCWEPTDTKILVLLSASGERFGVSHIPYLYVSSWVLLYPSLPGVSSCVVPCPIVFSCVLLCLNVSFSGIFFVFVCPALAFSVIVHLPHFYPFHMCHLLASHILLCLIVSLCVFFIHTQSLCVLIWCLLSSCVHLFSNMLLCVLLCLYSIIFCPLSFLTCPKVSPFVLLISTLSSCIIFSFLDFVL